AGGIEIWKHARVAAPRGEYSQQREGGRPAVAISHLHQGVEDGVGLDSGIEEAARGLELETRAIITVAEGRPRDESRHAGLAEQHAAKVLVSRFEAQPFSGERMQRSARADQLREPGPIVCERPSGREHDEVRSAPKPHVHVWEYLAQAAHDAGQYRKRQLVKLNPLAEDSAVGEPGARDTEELGRVESRNASHPRIGRLGDDHIVAVPVEL